MGLSISDSTLQTKTDTRWNCLPKLLISFSNSFCCIRCNHSPESPLDIDNNPNNATGALPDTRLYLTTEQQSLILKNHLDTITPNSTTDAYTVIYNLFNALNLKHQKKVIFYLINQFKTKPKHPELSNFVNVLLNKPDYYLVQYFLKSSHGLPHLGDLINSIPNKHRTAVCCILDINTYTIDTVTASIASNIDDLITQNIEEANIGPTPDLAVPRIIDLCQPPIAEQFITDTTVDTRLERLFELTKISNPSGQAILNSILSQPVSQNSRYVMKHYICWLIGLPDKYKKPLLDRLADYLSLHEKYNLLLENCTNDDLRTGLISRLITASQTSQNPQLAVSRIVDLCQPPIAEQFITDTTVDTRLERLFELTKISTPSGQAILDSILSQPVSKKSLYMMNHYIRWFNTLKDAEKDPLLNRLKHHLISPNTSPDIAHYSFYLLAELAKNNCKKSSQTLINILSDEYLESEHPCEANKKTILLIDRIVSKWATFDSLPGLLKSYFSLMKNRWWALPAHYYNPTPTLP